MQSQYLPVGTKRLEDWGGRFKPQACLAHRLKTEVRTRKFVCQVLAMA